MATVSERLLGDHSSPGMMATVIGLLKELEDDRLRDPSDELLSLVTPVEFSDAQS